MKNEHINKLDPLVLRDSLKSTLHNEIALLPDLLSELKPKDRLNIILKIMPYILPSVKSVHYSEGDPLDQRKYFL